MPKSGIRAWAVALCAMSVIGCPGPAAPPLSDGGALDSGPPGCAVDADCSDGVFCNGAEMCQPASTMRDARGCVDASSGPCMPTQTCDEAADHCVTTCDVEPDADGDGVRAVACGGTDCDDADPLRAPSHVEVCDAAGRDEDCDGTTFGDRDRDRDTFVDAACCNGTGSTRVCGTDCDDSAAAVSPVAGELCDARDNDCDGAADEGVLVHGFADQDGDLHGDPGTPRDACPGAGRFSLLDDDCNDTNGRVHGAQVEVCDGLDNDCNGVIDDHTRAVTWYRDADADGFGSAAGGTMIACNPPAGYELLPFDCDDSRAGTSPIADEICNGRDDDCNGRPDFVIRPGDSEDDDADGFVDASCGGLGDDCDDGDPGVHPGAEPYCDGRDHDCNGVVDVGAPVAWYRDEDGDGWGAGAAMMSCDPPTGYVRQDGDCDDSLPRRSPSEPDDCDGLDDDCDGTIDESATRVAYYADMDGDGAGGGAPMLACAQPAGYGLYPTDCDDTTTARYEGAVEVCDGIDNDCDGTPDDGADVVCTVPGASATCVSGGCVVSACLPSFANCDGAMGNGCEVDTRTDAGNCGGCTMSCASYPASSATCAASTCGFACDAGAADCDAIAANGCEASTATDPQNCGSCGRRCAPRANAPASCTAGACSVTCDPAYTDCDGNLANGCEVNTGADPRNCGACAHVCPLATDACVRGDCLPVPFDSTGTEGPLDVTGAMVIPPGVHQYSTIHIRAGALVTTNGSGVLELWASGDVLIEGTVDLSGGRGGSPIEDAATPYDSHNGGGGDTGNPLGVGAGGRDGCNPGGGGGDGAPGAAGSACTGGGGFGGGAGAGIDPAYNAISGAPIATGSGGGGFAGGGGGNVGTAPGGVGASISGESVGGSGMCGGGEPSAGVYAGASCPSGDPGGGGGGSIGAPAASDLAVATTFQSGSGGGGGRASYFGPATGGGGGGGGGGAIRIASLTRITITATGTVRADGGAGGASQGLQGSGGGGSGGVVYLAAPEIDMHGTVSAVGGAGGAPRYPGGAGGLGRVRLSVLPEHCTLYGTWGIPLVSGCSPTRGAPVPGHVYIDTFPF